MPEGKKGDVDTENHAEISQRRRAIHSAEFADAIFNTLKASRITTTSVRAILSHHEKRKHDFSLQYEKRERDLSSSKIYSHDAKELDRKLKTHHTYGLRRKLDYTRVRLEVLYFLLA